MLGTFGQNVIDAIQSMDDVRYVAYADHGTVVVEVYDEHPEIKALTFAVLMGKYDEGIRCIMHTVMKQTNYFEFTYKNTAFSIRFKRMQSMK